MFYTCLECAPSGGPAELAEEILVLLGQADGRDVRHVVDGSVQLQDGHVKAVRLGCELKVGVHFDLSHSVGESWQWLNL